jgi:hypothetical protein
MGVVLDVAYLPEGLGVQELNVLVLCSTCVQNAGGQKESKMMKWCNYVLGNQMIIPNSLILSDFFMGKTSKKEYRNLPTF